MALHIPRDDQVTIAELMAKPPESLHSLLQAILKAQPRLRARDMASQIAKECHLDEDQVSSYIGVLGSIQAVANELGQPLSEVISAIHETLRTNDIPNVPESDKLEPFATFVGEAIAPASPVGLSLKAYDLLIESERIYSRGRVISDVRPIFGQGSTDQPIASVIVHTLKITYSKRGTPFSEDFFVEMDAKDIQNLREVLDRASKKEAAMTKTYANSTKFVVL